MTHSARTPVWTWAVPILGLFLFVAAITTGYGEDFASNPIGIVETILLIPLLIGVVFAAVYHAEDVAHIMGEPAGTARFDDRRHGHRTVAHHFADADRQSHAHAGA